MDLTNLKNQFTEIYGTGDTLCYFSPSRVNLIGEHVDYNGGLVFPCALDFGTYGFARKRNDNKFNFASSTFDLRVSRDLDDMDYRKEDDWANFLKGIVNEFKSMGKEIGGLDILIYGNVPNGSGLSSSASIELLMSYILNDIFKCGLTQVDLVKLSQKVENEYIGVNCGIMDQFAIGMGKKDNAILLDCGTLKYEYVPLKLGNHKLIIGNTKKRRELVDSKYNERRSQCEKAVEYLNTELNIKVLGELTPDEFEKNKHLIKDEVVLKRATHVIYEIKRTFDAVEALKNDDLELLGKLMNQSHDSLRDLYEVTGIELDTLVSEALKIDGTLGSRMTGAGFGGCTVSLVKDEAIDSFIQKVTDAYTEKIGYAPEFYVANVADGTRAL